MEIYLRITQLYLEEQDHISAEAYLNRAGLLQAEVSNNIELQILYKVIHHCRTPVSRFCNIRFAVPKWPIFVESFQMHLEDTYSYHMSQLYMLMRD